MARKKPAPRKVSSKKAASKKARPQTASRKVPKKRNLSRQKILTAAMKLADKRGIDSLSMRALGKALGVEAMSLYNHVASKDDLLDGIVELVVSQISTATDVQDWKSTLRSRAIATHRVLRAHPWAAGLMESRLSPGAETMDYINATLGTLRNAGFSVELAYHAFLTVDSYVYGFAFQEVNWPFDAEFRSEVLKALRTTVPAGDYPFIDEAMDYSIDAPGRQDDSGYEQEFEFGLDLVLDGLEQCAQAGKKRRSPRKKKKAASR